jgi:hypothetical protein
MKNFNNVKEGDIILNKSSGQYFLVIGFDLEFYNKKMPIIMPLQLAKNSEDWEKKESMP